MGDGKAHSSRSCLAIELRLVEREDLLVKTVLQPWFVIY